ncbi:MAG: phosphopyruvate hydratase [Alphaproteobacteria bacterium]|nr:phosphopyruvate hydratase [Alphaproteobacteria bacterium]
MRDGAIVQVLGRRVWDSRGRPTVEAEVHLAGGAVGRAIAPAGASTGSGEAVDLRDGGARFGGFDVRQAVSHVLNDINVALTGVDALDQGAVDAALIDLDGTANKGRLGGNAMIAVSMAAAHAGAQAVRQPLWRWLSNGGKAQMPRPMIQIFGGGAHAGKRVDVQDFMITTPGASSFVEALNWTADVYRTAGALMAEAGRLHGVADEGGYWPEFASNEEALVMLTRAIERAGYQAPDQVGIALDIAASQFGRGGRYRFGLDGRELDRDGLADLLVAWTTHYPIVSIEDPFAEDDSQGFIALMNAVGDRIQIVGDDLLVTNARRIDRAVSIGACNAALIKPNQAGTLTETRAAFDAARAAGWHTIISARSGESEDTTIVHLAVGWNAGQLKVGSFSRSERMAKWNEGIRIEEALAR